MGGASAKAQAARSQRGLQSPGRSLGLVLSSMGESHGVLSRARLGLMHIWRPERWRLWGESLTGTCGSREIRGSRLSGRSCWFLDEDQTWGAGWEGLWHQWVDVRPQAEGGTKDQSGVRAQKMGKLGGIYELGRTSRQHITKQRHHSAHKSP